MSLKAEIIVVISFGIFLVALLSVITLTYEYGMVKIEPITSNGVEHLIDESQANKGPAKEPDTSLKVLMYHRIVDDKMLSDQYETCVHVDDFHKQLELLDKLGYTPITFKDYQHHLNNELVLPKKPIILTFDDGYMDFYELAYPLLLQYGMRGVLFVLADRNIRTNYWDYENGAAPVAPLMEDRHIKELYDKGFEIGAHSLGHQNLEELDEVQLKNNVNKSKIILESITGNKVSSFSYPFGRVNETIKKKVSESGFNFGCSVFSGPPQFAADRFEIRRIAIHNDTTILGFVTKLLTPYEYAEWAWDKINMKK